MKLLVLLFLVFTYCAAEVYFQEEFGEGWEQRWVTSKSKEADGTLGKFEWTAGKYHDESDKGIQTSEDAHFYQISAAMKEFSNEGKDLVIQYSVKHDQKLDCGGAYVKILPAGLDQENFNGDSPYNIMFGPDVCGNTKRVHVIFNYKGQNHLIKQEIRPEMDEFTHVYTLIVKPDNSFRVLIDNKEVRSGKITDEFDVLPPTTIPDPDAKKPSDWVDQKEVADPAAVKPEDWDTISAEIPDANAKKPEDWDDELDGEWEVPMIDNPEYKGEWKAPMIANPAYQGEWVHPKIDNPAYKNDETLYRYQSSKFIGIEIWQVKSGTIFDNILVTDDAALAKEWAERSVHAQEDEKTAKDAKKSSKSDDDDESDEVDEDIEDFDFDDFAGDEGEEAEHDHDHDHDHDEL
jgi:calreticulin